MTESQKVRMVEIDDAESGQRIDNFLLKHLKGVPKSRIYSIIRKGEVRVNKGRIKQGYRLEAGDLVRIPPVRTAERGEKPRASHQMQERLTQSIIYQDDGLLVINKPAGIAVHGGSGVSLGVIEAFRGIFPEQRFLELVHRLDKGTSGCLVLAKKRSALTGLHEQIKAGRMEKEYLAVVAGRWKGQQHRVDAPLYKFTLPSGERRVRVSRDGKASLTYFSTLELFASASLVQARLETGRTHQIRVHCQYSGHPVLGDDKYGDEEANQQAAMLGCKRLCLHASSLKFQHPLTGEEMEFFAPVDEELENFLTRLRS